MYTPTSNQTAKIDIAVAYTPPRESLSFESNKKILYRIHFRTERCKDNVVII
jgi:hypothetical protein